MWQPVCDTAWKIFIDTAGQSSVKRNTLLRPQRKCSLKSFLTPHPPNPGRHFFSLCCQSKCWIWKLRNEAKAVGWTDEMKTLKFCVMLKLHQHPGVCLCAHLHTVNSSAFNWIQFSFHFVCPPHVYTHPHSSWVHSQAAFRMASANACSIKSCSGFGESRPAWGFNGRRTSLKDQHAALWYTTERRWKEGQQTHTRSYQRTKTGSSDGLGAEGGLLLSHRCVFVVTASSMTCWQWLSGSGSQTSHVCSFSWSLKCMLTLLMCSWHFSEQTWTKTMQCDCYRIILTVNGWICDDIELSDIY